MGFLQDLQTFAEDMIICHLLWMKHSSKLSYNCVDILVLIKPENIKNNSSPCYQE